MNKKQILYDYAMSFVGLPYIWGGDDPIKGFDCSGLVLELLWSQGIGPVNDTTAQGLFDYYFRGDEDKLTRIPGFGDLAFFGKSLARITHIGMCIDTRLMLEAGGGGSRTTDREHAASQNAYVRIRPIWRRSDFLITLNPRWDFR